MNLASGALYLGAGTGAAGKTIISNGITVFDWGEVVGGLTQVSIIGLDDNNTLSPSTGTISGLRFSNNKNFGITANLIDGNTVGITFSAYMNTMGPNDVFGVTSDTIKFSLKDSGDTITVNETEKRGERVREYTLPPWWRCWWWTFPA